jgi:hypothetical protein
MSQDKLEHLQSVLLSTILAVTGGASALDHIEQVGRIALLGISIVSGLFLILVNWEKAKHQINKWINNGKHI